MQNQQKPVIGHYAFLYACQFGPFRSKGAKYIAQILLITIFPQVLRNISGLLRILRRKRASGQPVLGGPFSGI